MRFDVARSLRRLFVFTAVSRFSPEVAIWVVYLTEMRGITLAQVAILEAFFWGVAIALEVPSGAFSDRFGRRLALAVAILAEALGLVLFAFADRYSLLLASYVLWSAGSAMRGSTQHAYLYETLAAAGRETEFTAQAGRLHALFIGGTVVGALLGAPLAAATALNVPVVLAACARAAALPLLLGLAEPPSAMEGAHVGYLQSVRQGARTLLRDKAAGWMALLSMSFAIPGVADLLLQPFLQRHNLPVEGFGVVYVGVWVLGIAGSLGSHRLPKLIGSRGAPGVLLFGAAVVLVAMGLVDHVLAVPGFALIAFARSAYYPLLHDYLNRRVSSGARATVLSVPPLLHSVTLVALLPGAGAIASGSLAWALLALGAVMLAAGGALYALWLRADRGSDPVVARCVP